MAAQRGSCALVFLAMAVASAGQCMPIEDCKKQVDEVVEDIRERIGDRLQQEVEDTLGVAPAALSVTSRYFADGILSSNMTDTRHEAALLEHFYNQMTLFSTVDWFYFGDTQDNRFIGLRKAWPCEVAKNCDYGTGSTKPATTPDVAAGSIVRLLSNPVTGRLEGWTTNPATGSDAVTLLYSKPFDTKERTWYKAAKDIPDSGSIPHVWVDPYVFSGGVLGVTVSRPVYAAGALKGVLAADYELTFLNTFLKEIPVSGNSTLFVMNAQQNLIANNKGAAVDVGVGDSARVLRYSESTDAVINTAGAAVLQKQPIFGQVAADWSVVSTTVQRGEFTVAGDARTYYFDAIGTMDGNSLKWVVVVASTDEDFFPVKPAVGSACGMTAVGCRSTLIAAQKSLRTRTILHFKEHTLDYLGSALAALNQVDAAYNMGNLNDGFCTTCGKLDWTNAAEQALLTKALKSTFEFYPEITWLYFGFDEKKIIGFRRNANADNRIEMWKTCEGQAPACKEGSSAFWEDTAQTKLVQALPDDKFWERAWFLLPGKAALSSPSEIAWTEPYVFGDGLDIGLTLVKKAFGGDWTSTGSMGVWGADYTTRFLSTFIKTMRVSENTVIFLMEGNQGDLIAASEGVAVTETGASGLKLIKATESATPIVKSAAKQLLAQWALVTSDQPYSLLIQPGEGVTEPWLLDSIKLRDGDANVKQTFDWVLAIVGPESDLYDLELAVEDGDDDGFPGWAIALIVIGVFVIVAGSAVAYFHYAKSKSPSFHTVENDGQTSNYHPPEEMQPSFKQTV